MNDSEIFNKNLLNYLQDPITDLLVKKSNLTDTQFETFIIDVLFNALSDNKITFDKKALFRTHKVSRGSFGRTLSQARKRIISSIYTVLLLGYVGVFDSKPFEEYEILAEKLREYLLLIKDMENQQSSPMLNRLEDELMIWIDNLSKPKALKTV